jgi:hypothetical protein
MRTTLFICTLAAAAAAQAAPAEKSARASEWRDSGYRSILPPQTRSAADLMREDAGEIAEAAAADLGTGPWSAEVSSDVVALSNGRYTARDRQNDLLFLQEASSAWTGTHAASGLSLEIGGEASVAWYARESAQSFWGTEGHATLYLPWMQRMLGDTAGGLGHSVSITGGYYANLDSGDRLLTLWETRHDLWWTFTLAGGRTRLTPGTSISWLRTAPAYNERTSPDVWFNAEHRINDQLFLLGAYRLAWHDYHATDRAEVRHTADLGLEWRPCRGAAVRLGAGWENNTDRSAGRTSYNNFSGTLGLTARWNF